MTLGGEVMAGLYALCAAVYAALTGLILVQARRSRTALLLAAACGVTAIWAATVAAGPSEGQFGGLAAASNSPARSRGTASCSTSIAAASRATGCSAAASRPWGWSP